MNILELKNVHKAFDGTTVIDGLTVSIPRRAFVAITGKSGSGKSTVLNMIGLLEETDGGSIYLCGKKLPGINCSKATMLRRNMINYLFQSYALISDMTVVDNLLVSMEFMELSKREKISRIDKVLKQLDIFPLKMKKINTLSGGEQQRVAIARCILKPGELILADEPTGSLDPHMTEIVFKMIRNLRDEHKKTVIMVTHDMSLAERTDFVIDLNKMK